MINLYLPAEERHLLADTANGSEQAFEQFYKNYSVYVSQVVNKYCKAGPIETVDWVQEVFLAVWKYRASLTEVKNIRFYLYSIAKNTVLRMQGLAIKSSINLLHITANDTLCEPYVEVDYQLMWSLFKQTVNALPPRQKKVFQLRYEAGLSGHQVGEVMGITYNTVKNLNRMAKQKLMDVLVA